MMKSLAAFIAVALIFVLVSLAHDACAGDYNRNYQYARSGSENPYGYYPEEKGYPNYPGPGRSQIYYACPYGDYISDRQGSCPVHGKSLIQKRPVQRGQSYY